MRTENEIADEVDDPVKIIMIAKLLEDYLKVLR